MKELKFELHSVSLCDRTILKSRICPKFVGYDFKGNNRQDIQYCTY
jgi:hypothetical protein